TPGIAGDRGRLPGARRRIQRSESRLAWNSRLLQFLSRQEPGSPRRSRCSGYEQRGTEEQDPNAAGPWAGEEISPCFDWLECADGWNPGGRSSGEIEALGSSQPSTTSQRPVLRPTSGRGRGSDPAHGG